MKLAIKPNQASYWPSGSSYLYAKWLIHIACLRSRDAHLCRQVKVPSCIHNKICHGQFASHNKHDSSNDHHNNIYTTTRQRIVEQEDEGDSKSTGLQRKWQKKKNSRKIAWVVLAFRLVDLPSEAWFRSMLSKDGQTFRYSWPASMAWGQACCNAWSTSGHRLRGTWHSWILP